MVSLSCRLHWVHRSAVESTKERVSLAASEQAEAEGPFAGKHLAAAFVATLVAFVAELYRD